MGKPSYSETDSNIPLNNKFMKLESELNLNKPDATEQDSSIQLILLQTTRLVTEKTNSAPFMWNLIILNGARLCMKLNHSSLALQIKTNSKTFRRKKLKIHKDQCPKKNRR